MISYFDIRPKVAIRFSFRRERDDLQSPAKKTDPVLGFRSSHPDSGIPIRIWESSLVLGWTATRANANGARAYSRRWDSAPSPPSLSAASGSSPESKAGAHRAPLQSDRTNCRGGSMTAQQFCRQSNCASESEWPPSIDLIRSTRAVPSGPKRYPATCPGVP